jgi:pyrroline-5-carboxylate reductase
MSTLGIIGTGHLASYTIIALRNGGYQEQIVVSPRNSVVAADLAERELVTIAENNQAVIDVADIILLSIRPQHFTEVVASLDFASEKIILSALAGISMSEHKAVLGDDKTIVRMMPSSFIEAGDAVFPIFPSNKAVETLLAHNAKVVVFDKEEHFDQSIIVSGFSTWSYALMDSAISWLEDKGWPKKVAREMVQCHLRGSTTYAAANMDKTIPEIYNGIATEGTYTKIGLDYLFDKDALDQWTAAMEAVHDRLTIDAKS